MLKQMIPPQNKTCFKILALKPMVRTNLGISSHLILLSLILNLKTLLGINIGGEILMETLSNPKTNPVLHTQICLVRPTIRTFNLIIWGTTRIIINNPRCLFLLSTSFYLHHLTHHLRRHYHH